MKSIEFWFSIGSTYTYLSVMRLDDVAKKAGTKVDWRPFSVRVLMQEMDNIPFVGKPAKERYMWRDLERRAARYGLPIQLPVDYPLQDFDRANRVAIVGREEGWCADYTRHAYRLWFRDGLPPGGEENLRASLQAAGQDAGRILERAESAETTAAYEFATDRARALGIFGSPTFVVDGSELFWGDDRLDDAIEYALQKDG